MLIDRRLYLPRSWIDDPARCKKARIPKAFQVFRTKAELALEMILSAKAEGIPFSFVGFDAHYGEQPWLLTRLEREAIVYLADIPCDSRVYLINVRHENCQVFSLFRIIVLNGDQEEVVCSLRSTSYFHYIQ